MENIKIISGTTIENGKLNRNNIFDKVNDKVVTTLQIDLTELYNNNITINFGDAYKLIINIRNSINIKF